MRVLVTGSTGFIGSHLVEKLGEKGFHLNTLIRRHGRNSLPPWLNKANIIYGDVTDATSVRSAVKDVNVVFHLASLLGRWQSEFDESEYYRINVKGTKLLIDACLREGIDHFVYLSTAGVMGRLKYIPADENHPLSPEFPYERSKYLAELALRELIAKKGLRATIIRPTHVYGPRDKNTVKLFRTIKRFGIFPLIGGGNSLFQPLYVDDLVKGLILCAENKEVSVGKTYLVAGREILTYRDFLLLSAQILNVSLRTFGISERLAKPIANISEKIGTAFNFEPPLTRSRVEFFSRNQAYKIEKIMGEIGFFPETDVKTGLQRMISWYKENALA